MDAFLHWVLLFDIGTTSEVSSEKRSSYFRLGGTSEFPRFPKPLDYRLRGRDERLEVVISMKAPLSQNEIQILGRHVAAISCQLSEVGELLNSRLGPQAE